MSKFVFIFRRGLSETSGMSPAEMQAHVRKWYAWSDALKAGGHEHHGQPLAENGRTIRGKDRVVTDGPYVETKDLVTGSMLIAAASLDDAVELARGCPAFDIGGSVEVRPAVELDV
ncbi:MAG: PhnB protein [bacterium]|nr:PhnB protein [bacterium]